MIINETKYSLEDIQYMYSQVHKTKRVIIIKIIYLLAGLLMFSNLLNGILKNKEWFSYLFSTHVSLDATGVLTLSLFTLEFLFGIACFILFFNYSNIMIRQLYNRHYKNLPERHIEISQDYIKVTSESNGAKEETTFDYSNIKSYKVKGNSLFLLFDAPQKATNVYLALHNDGYKSGSLEDVLKLLESNKL